MRNLIAAKTMKLAFITAHVIALSTPATAYPCAEFVRQWLDLLEAKGDALQGLNDARSEASNAWHEHYMQRNELKDFIFHNVVVVVAKATDSQRQAGAETPDYGKIGQAIFDQLDALNAVMKAEHDAHLTAMSARNTVLQAQIDAHPYLKRITDVDGAVLDLIECFREQS